MPYTVDLLEKINVIKQQVVTDPELATTNFISYLDTLVNLGTYSPTNWPKVWTDSVYEFGELFSKNDPTVYIQEIGNKLESLTSVFQKEGLEFLKSEILWNYYPQDSEFTNAHLTTLVSRYPLNAEFHHSLFNHWLSRNKPERASSECVLAMKLNPIFIKDAFNAQRKLFNKYLSLDNIEAAKKLQSEMAKEPSYKVDSVWTNSLAYMNDRIVDHSAISAKIDRIPEIIKSETEKERRRLVEVLGVFSAILAFILTNVSIGKNFDIRQAIEFMFGTGLVLIIFVITISYVFTFPRGKDKFWDKKTQVLLLILVTFFVYFIVTRHKIS